MNTLYYSKHLKGLGIAKNENLYSFSYRSNKLNAISFSVIRSTVYEQFSKYHYWSSGGHDR